MKIIKTVFTKLSKHFFPIISIALLVGIPIYFLRPLKKTVSLFPTATAGKTQLTCETTIGAALFPQPNWGKKPSEKVEASLSTGGSKIAIEMKEKTLNFLTSASVGVGVMEPYQLTILNDDNESLVALAYEKASGLSPHAVDSFILNKKSGFAVWAKSQSSIFSVDNPDGQVYYLHCY